jgi:quercetin dioxygenase-like cupin family protein
LLDMSEGNASDMDTWEINSLDAASHKPAILSSTEAARVVAITLPAGAALDDHEVHERAWVIVTDGEIEVAAGGETTSGGPGLVAEFGPQERHEVRAVSDARIVLVLAPWPGDGHPGAMSLDDKANARERARERASA